VPLAKRDGMILSCRVVPSETDTTFRHGRLGVATLTLQAAIEKGAFRQAHLQFRLRKCKNAIDELDAYWYRQELVCHKRLQTYTRMYKLVFPR